MLPVIRPKSPQIWKTHKWTFRSTWKSSCKPFEAPPHYLNDLRTYEPQYKQILHPYSREFEPSVQSSEPLDYHLNLENIHTDTPKASLNVRNRKINSLLAPIHPSQLIWHSRSLSTAMATILRICRTFTCVCITSNSAESHYCAFSFWTVLFVNRDHIKAYLQTYSIIYLLWALLFSYHTRPCSIWSYP